jgi:hypothetical protein
LSRRDDAEAREDPAEQVVAGDLASDLAEGLLCVGQLLRNQLAGVSLVEQPVRLLDVSAGAAQRVEVAGARRQRALARRVEPDAVLQVPTQQV